MAELLPKLMVIAGGLCLSFVLLAFWQSLRGVIVHAGQQRSEGIGMSPARAKLLRNLRRSVRAPVVGDDHFSENPGVLHCQLGLADAQTERVGLVKARQYH